MAPVLLPRALLLAALLVAPAVVALALAPVASAQVPADCTLYSSQTVEVPGGAWYVRTQEYRCSSTSSGTSMTHHVSIVRVAEARGDPQREDDDRILLHAEYQAATYRESDGDGSRRTSVALKDENNGGRVGYHELEHDDSTIDGGCSSRVSYYRGSDTHRTANFLVPACSPVHDVLP